MADFSAGDFGEANRAGIFPFTEQARPLFCGGAQICDGEAAMIWREARELDDTRCEQRFGAARVSPAVMVIGGSELNEALQKSFLRLGFDEPDFFPDFMSFGEFP